MKNGENSDDEFQPQRKALRKLKKVKKETSKSDSKLGHDQFLPSEKHAPPSLLRKTETISTENEQSCPSNSWTDFSGGDNINVFKLFEKPLKITEDFKSCPTCEKKTPSDEYADHVKQCLRSKFSFSKNDVESLHPSESAPEKNETENHQYGDSPVLGREDDNSDDAPSMDAKILEMTSSLVLDCPLCCQSFKTNQSRQSHAKKCAKKRGIDATLLFAQLDSQKQHFEENLAKGVVISPYYDRLKQTLSKSKASAQKLEKKAKGLTRIARLSVPNSKEDENVQLAVALSLSKSPEYSASDDVFQRLHNNQKLFEKRQGFGDRLLGPPPPPPLVVTQPKTKEGIRRTRFLNMKLHTIDVERNATEIQTRAPERRLWTMSDCSSLAGGRFYVETLDMTQCEVEAGSKLKSVSSIPGRNTTMIEETGKTSDQSQLQLNINTTTQNVLELLASQNDPCTQTDGFFFEEPPIVKEPPGPKLMSYLLKSLGALVDNPDMADLKIMCKDKESVYAHNFVINLYRNNHERVNKEIIEMDKIEKRIVINVLKLLYDFETDVIHESDSKSSWQEVAEKLDLKKDVREMLSSIFSFDFEEIVNSQNDEEIMQRILNKTYGSDHGSIDDSESQESLESEDVLDAEDEEVFRYLCSQKPANFSKAEIGDYVEEAEKISLITKGFSNRKSPDEARHPDNREAVLSVIYSGKNSQDVSIVESPVKDENQNSPFSLSHNISSKSQSERVSNVSSSPDLFGDEEVKSISGPPCPIVMVERLSPDITTPTKRSQRRRDTRENRCVSSRELCHSSSVRPVDDDARFLPRRSRRSKSRDVSSPSADAKHQDFVDLTQTPETPKGEFRDYRENATTEPKLVVDVKFSRSESRCERFSKTQVVETMEKKSTRLSTNSDNKLLSSEAPIDLCLNPFISLTKLNLEEYNVSRNESPPTETPTSSKGFSSSPSSSNRLLLRIQPESTWRGDEISCSRPSSGRRSSRSTDTPTTARRKISRTPISRYEKENNIIVLVSPPSKDNNASSALTKTAKKTLDFMEEDHDERKINSTKSSLEDLESDDLPEVPLSQPLSPYGGQCPSKPQHSVPRYSFSATNATVSGSQSGPTISFDLSHLRDGGGRSFVQTEDIDLTSDDLIHHEEDAFRYGEDFWDDVDNGRPDDERGGVGSDAANRKEKFMPSQPARVKGDAKKRKRSSSSVLDSVSKRIKEDDDDGLDLRRINEAKNAFKFRRSKLLGRTSSASAETRISEENPKKVETETPTISYSSSLKTNCFDPTYWEDSFDDLADFPSASTPATRRSNRLSLLDRDSPTAERGSTRSPTFKPRSARTTPTDQTSADSNLAGRCSSRSPSDVPASHESIARRILNGGKKKKPPPSPFTPKPRYDNMATPELKVHLSKYGVRQNLRKNQLVKVAEDLFDKMHQYETDSEYEKTFVESPRTSRLQSSASTSQAPTSSATSAISVAREDFSSDEDDYLVPVPEFLEESYLQDREDEDATTTTQLTKEEIVKKSIFEFVTKDKNLYQRVLSYEPVDFEDFHSKVRGSGIRCNKGVTINWLDDMGIQFTMKNTKTGERRKEKAEKRQERFKKKKESQRKRV